MNVNWNKINFDDSEPFGTCVSFHSGIDRCAQTKVKINVTKTFEFIEKTV